MGFSFGGMGGGVGGAAATDIGLVNFTRFAPGRLTAPSGPSAVYDGGGLPTRRMWLTPFSVPLAVNVTTGGMYRSSTSGAGTWNCGIYSSRYVSGTGYLPDSLLVWSFGADNQAQGFHTTPLVIALAPHVLYWAAYSFDVSIGARCWHSEYMGAPFGCVPDGWSHCHMAYNDVSDLGYGVLPASFGSRVFTKDTVDLPQFILAATPA